MKFETLGYELRDSVVVLTLDRAERLNAINSVMAGELEQAWTRIEGDEDVSAVVVTGAGDRALCTGWDVADDGSGLESLRLTAVQNRCFKPVVTAVNGMVCGGGLHFVADSDLVICAEHATFFDTHVNVGLVAGLEPIGLARRIALEPVLRMALLGKKERMDAARAFEVGLVGEVVSQVNLQTRALEIAATMDGGAKRAIWESLN